MSASGRLDTQGVWAATEAQGAQLEPLMAQLADLTPAPPLTSWAIFGTGTGRIAAQVGAAYLGQRQDRPLWCGAGHRDLPAFVGPGTGVLTVAGYDGDDALYQIRQEARQRGAYVCALGSAKDGPESSPLLVLPTVGTTGRVAVAHALTATVVALASGTSVQEAAMSDLRAASRQLGRRTGLLIPGSPADEVARRIGRTIPLVYGAGLPGMAAQHWKAQVNLTAKTPALVGQVPGVLDDEVAGWGQNGDVTRQVLTLIALRHAGELPAEAADYDAALAAMDEVMGDEIVVWGEGDSDLVRFMDLAFFGDAVSLHLAEREGIDPGPVSIGAGHGLAR